MKPSKTSMYRAIFSTTIKKLPASGQQLHRPADWKVERGCSIQGEKQTHTGFVEEAGHHPKDFC